MRPRCARPSRTSPETRSPTGPSVAATLLRAARAERDRRGLPLRQRDAQELADLERTLAAAGSQLTLRDRPFNDLVAELAE